MIETGPESWPPLKKLDYIDKIPYVPFRDERELRGLHDDPNLKQRLKEAGLIEGQRGAVTAALNIAAAVGTVGELRGKSDEELEELNRRGYYIGPRRARILKALLFPPQEEETKTMVGE